MCLKKCIKVPLQTNKMKIGIVVSAFPMETFIQNKVKQLLNRGHSVYIFTSSFNALLYNKSFKSYKLCKVIVISKKALLFTFFTHQQLWTTSITQKIIAESFLLHQINRLQLHIIHFEFSTIAAAYQKILNKLHPKLVVSCRGTNEKVRMQTDKKMKVTLGKVFA